MNHALYTNYHQCESSFDYIQYKSLERNAPECGHLWLQQFEMFVNRINIRELEIKSNNISSEFAVLLKKKI